MIPVDRIAPKSMGIRSTSSCPIAAMTLSREFIFTSVGKELIALKPIISH